MRLVIAVAALCAFSLSACGKKPESDKPTVSVTPGGYSVKGNDGSATITAGAGAASAAAARLPDFAPVYPGGKVEGTIASVADAGDGAEGGSVVFTTTASPRQVIDFYRRKTEAAGLAAKMNADMGQATMFVAQDEATKRGVQVIVGGQDGGSNVTVTWSTARP